MGSAFCYPERGARVTVAKVKRTAITTVMRPRLCSITVDPAADVPMPLRACRKLTTTSAVQQNEEDERQEDDEHGDR